MVLRFLGGALGVPFMPLKSMLGTDMLAKKRFRPKKAEVVECPFTGEKVVLVPSVRPDFSIVHAQRVDQRRKRADRRNQRRRCGRRKGGKKSNSVWLRRLWIPNSYAPSQTKQLYLTSM